MNSGLQALHGLLGLPDCLRVRPPRVRQVGDRAAEFRFQAQLVLRRLGRTPRRLGRGPRRGPRARCARCAARRRGPRSGGPARAAPRPARATRRTGRRGGRPWLRPGPPRGGAGLPARGQPPASVRPAGRPRRGLLRRLPRLPRRGPRPARPRPPAPPWQKLPGLRPRTRAACAAGIRPRAAKTRWMWAPRRRSQAASNSRSSSGGCCSPDREHAQPDSSGRTRTPGAARPAPSRARQTPKPRSRTFVSWNRTTPRPERVLRQVSKSCLTAS